jgi:hypothetical protein
MSNKKSELPLAARVMGGAVMGIFSYFAISYFDLWGIQHGKAIILSVIVGFIFFLFGKNVWNWLEILFWL